MKKVWVKIDPWDKTKAIAAIEAGADGIVLPQGGSSQAKELGVISTIAPDGDLQWGKDVVPFQVKEREDVEKACQVPVERILVVEAEKWKMIPWENLVARRKGIYALVTGYEEAKAALGALEKGVDGLVVQIEDPAEAERIVGLAKNRAEKLDLEAVRVSRVARLGLGDRVCIDTCMKMARGEGMLVGNASQGLFLVHSESLPNPYTEPRPFRVNAGAVHSYIRVPAGRTAYLSELQWGMEVLVVNSIGETKLTHVGRTKTERRPLVMVEAEAEQEKMSCVLQNAETVRLVAPGGEPLSIARLKKGDEVLVFREKGARHLGRVVEERIEES